MFHARIRRTMIALAASSALIGGALAPAIAHADTPGGGGSGAGKGCAVFHPESGTYEQVPEGTLIISLGGHVMQCQNGGWVKVDRVVSTGTHLGVAVGSPVVAARL